MKKSVFFIFVITLITILLLSLVACDKYTSIAHKSDFYHNLTREEKDKFDTNLQTIINNADFLDLSNSEKEAVIDGYIQSEKLKKEIAIEQEQDDIAYNKVIARLKGYSQDIEFAVENNFGSISDVVFTELSRIKGELENTITSTSATTQEISSAQSKLEEIKAVEQEFVYYAVNSAVKRAVSSNSNFNYFNRMMSIRKVYGMFKSSSSYTLYFNADFIKSSNSFGVEIIENINALCDVQLYVDENESYQELIFGFAGVDVIGLREFCINKNADWHKEYWEENKHIIHDKYSIDIELGYTYSIIMSWESEDDYEHPRYFLQCYDPNGEPSNCYLAEYISDHGSDSQTGEITPKWRFSGWYVKIFPEFWAQAEIENKK